MDKKFIALCACAVLLSVGCTKDQDGTKDDGDDLGYTLKVLSFEGPEWTSLIDSPEYGGNLLYSTATYSWYDKGNTELASESVKTDWGEYGVFWTCGHAVSNYTVDSFIGADYMHQLSIVGESGKGGHDGSANFAVHYGYDEYGTSPLPSIYFKDGVARVIDHMYVKNTAYGLANCYDSDGAAVITSGQTVKITAEGTDASGMQTTSEFYLVNGPSGIIADWTKWDLSVLGSVTKVTFNISGNITNDYGFSYPAYFAYDDVAVRFQN